MLCIMNSKISRWRIKQNNDFAEVDEFLFIHIIGLFMLK